MDKVMQYLGLAQSLALRGLERVEIPRTIVIKNLRLGIALRTAQALAVIFFVWLVFYRSQWIKVVSPHKMGVLAAWDETSSYTQQEREDRSSGFCSRLSAFDYVYSPKWRYENYSCSTPLLQSERYWKEGDSLIYVPTAFEESRQEVVYVGDAGDCSGVAQECGAPGGWVHEEVSQVCRCATKANFLVTGVDALTIAFDHGYSAIVSADADVSDILGGAREESALSSQRSDVSCDEEGSCDAKDVSDGMTKEMKTIVVVVDNDGHEQLVKEFDAPSTVHISLQEVFAGAGISLDTETKTNPSLLRCGSPGAGELTCAAGARRLPAVRQTGMSININLQYSNRRTTPWVPCEGCLQQHVGPLCKAVVTLEPTWQSRPKLDCEEPASAATGQSICTSRYYYGLRVTFKATGSFGVFDAVLLAVTMGAGLVYLGIPLFIIDGIAMYFIGALSNVYRKADKEEVAVDTQLAGFVIRMIMAQSAFETVTGGEGNSMTKEMLLERIKACVEPYDKKNRLDKQEQIKLAELVMQVLDMERNNVINMHEFVHGVTSNDPVNLKDAIKLFDDDRKLHCLERVFKRRSYASHSNQNTYFRKEDGEYKLDGDLQELVVTQRRTNASRSSSETGKDSAPPSESSRSSEPHVDLAASPHSVRL